MDRFSLSKKEKEIQDNDSLKQKVDANKSEESEIEIKDDASDVAADIQQVKPDGLGIGGVLNDIVINALNKKSSDIHIEPREDNVIVRYRIDGILRDIYTIPKEFEESLIFKIKVNADLRTDEHFAPQDGRIAFQVGKDETLDTRISIMPTSKGEKVVIRLLTQKGRSYTLEDLGLRQRELDIVKKSYLKPYGTIFASGPTGSGKTTTLYAILRTINSREKNITTIEDPVEYEIEGVNHIQINVKSGLTFDKGLRSILRQDPNVIMVGEIRDSETAKIAVNAAMTGHLVLSTIHTNDSITTIPRLVEMGVDPYLVASTLNVIVAQRLARRLCEKCKQKKRYTDEEYQEYIRYRPDISEVLKDEREFFHEVGCSECSNTGFNGRIGLYEVLEISENIRRIILEKSSNTDDIYTEAKKNGLTTIVEDAISKLKEGILSLSEVVRVTALKE